MDDIFDAGIVVAVILVLMLGFCGYGLYKAVQHAGIRADRCKEINGYRVSGKYNGAMCRVNGYVVDVDYDDYKSQAENARAK